VRLALSRPRSDLRLSTASPRFGGMRLVTIVCATAVLAACTTPGSDHAGVATELDRARPEITPPLGATTYTLDSSRLRDQPGDENRSLAQSLGQLPGVTLGPNGQLRVRGQ
jgi:hypothetical protein